LARAPVSKHCVIPAFALSQSRWMSIEDAERRGGRVSVTVFAHMLVGATIRAARVVALRSVLEIRVYFDDRSIRWSHQPSMSTQRSEARCLSGNSPQSFAGDAHAVRHPLQGRPPPPAPRPPAPAVEAVSFATVFFWPKRPKADGVHQHCDSIFRIFYLGVS